MVRCVDLTDLTYILATGRFWSDCVPNCLISWWKILQLLLTRSRMWLNWRYLQIHFLHCWLKTSPSTMVRSETRGPRTSTFNSIHHCDVRPKGKTDCDAVMGRVKWESCTCAKKQARNRGFSNDWAIKCIFSFDWYGYQANQKNVS